MRGLRFGYRRDRVVLDGVDLGIRPGRTALLGPNGAGKTTLLKIVAGAVRFREGTLRHRGHPVDPRRRSREYRRDVGWLPQHVTPFSGLSAREHVAYAGWLKGMPRAEAWESALSALDSVGLSQRRDERADRLSGGQTRRLGIAATLVHDAGILLLDEPTAGLDPREKERLLEILEPLERTRAVVLSTHDTDGALNSDARIVVLVSGRIAFDGDHDAFTAHGDPGSDSRRVRSAYASFVPEE